MFALCDLNNAYCSFERVFNPRLRGVPCVVLGSGDGCIIARSQESKDLGLKMGSPFHDVRDLVEKHGIVALSANFSLYGSMSNRVMQLLREFSPMTEQYSIDEIFLRVDGLIGLWPSYVELGQAMRAKVDRCLGLPMGVGVSNTKTRAKLANHLAKKRAEFAGVCCLEDLGEAEQRAYFKSLPVSNVWGVGARFDARLQGMGIHTVMDLHDASPKLMRQHFGVVMERTIEELRGTSCLELEEISPPKKQIVVSRSFGAMVTEYDELRETVSSFTQRAAEKLRQQHSVCNAVNVFIMTNRFRERDRQYSNGITIPLTEATSDSRRLIAAVLYGLRRIFLKGYQYKKAGIMLLELSPAAIRQQSLFSRADPRSEELMRALDRLNLEYGRNTVSLASAGIQHRWSPLSQKRSPNYTTRWEDIPVAKAN